MKEKKNKFKDFQGLLELSSLGLTFVFSIFIGLAIGLFLDSKLKTKPVFTLIFLLMGIIAGFYNIYRTIKRSKGNE